VRILLVDDHAVVRAGLRQLLMTALDAAIDEARDGASMALALAKGPRPDLVLLDLGLPGPGGLALLPRLRQEGLRVLVLTMHAEPLYARRALDAGAAGYVSKNIPPQDLLEAIRLVHAGRKYVEPRMAEELAIMNMDTANRLQSLTARDIDIMRLLAHGRGMAEIATLLGVSYKTIANTASAIRGKLGVARTADLIRLAIAMQDV
jgi:DNA-binding NarL/FixJ family response regulator